MESVVSRKSKGDNGTEITEYLAPNGRWVPTIAHAEKMLEGLAKATVRNLSRSDRKATFEHFNI